VYLQVAAVDHITALLACNGILLALFARERTGQGQRVETNLLDGAALINAHELTAYANKPPRAGLPRTQWGLHALHGLYETTDGWLCLTLEQEKQWTALCEAIGRTELCTNVRFTNVATRLQQDEALTAALAATFRQRTTTEWLAKLESAGVPCAPVVADFNQRFVCDAQTVANEMIVTQQHATLGEVQMAHQWLRFSETPIACTKPTPLLGQHTHEVLMELGYSTAEIEALFAQKVIARESGT
jgi:formyl-CoA transferase/CoA:oxalate CoA-transferase